MQNITVTELKERLERHNEKPMLLDVREPWEVAVCSFDNAIHIPMREIPTSLHQVPANENLVVVCHHGVRSLQVMAWLRGNGFDRAASLRGGINAWARAVDPTMATY